MYDPSNFPELKPGVTYVLRRELGATDPFEVSQQVPGASQTAVDSARRLAKARPGFDAVVACYDAQTGHLVVYDIETGQSSDIDLGRPAETRMGAVYVSDKVLPSVSGDNPERVEVVQMQARDYTYPKSTEEIALIVLKEQVKVRDTQVLKESVKECFDWAEEFVAESERRRKKTK
jgi:hypothetical protein